MIVPNKITTFRESILGKVTFILDELRLNEESIIDLYYKTADRFEDINEYILAIDVLYILSAIEYTRDKKGVRIC